jgi:tetratricopeptide (TPR) repeat protein
MLLANKFESVWFATPTDSLPTAPAALRAITPLSEALGLSDSPPTTTSEGQPLAERADEELKALQQGIIAQAEQLAAQHPRSPTVWARLAQAHHNKDNTQKAIEAARRALSLALNRKTRQSIRRPSSTVVVDSAACYVAATVLAATGRAAEAEEALIQLPLSGEHRVVAAALAAERGDYSTALDRLELTTGATAAALRGWLYLQVGRYDQALSELRRIVVSGHPTPAVLTNMAYAYAVLGSLRKAVRAAQQAVKLAPMSHTASFNLVGYLLTAGTAGPALAELDRLAKVLGGDDADIVLARAGVRLSDGQEQAALQTLRQGLQRVQLRGSARARAEVRGNIALLEGRLGLRPHSKVIEDIRTQIQRADGRSVTLVIILADLLHTTTAHPEIEALSHHLEPHQTTEELLPLKVRLAHLSANFDNEAILARRWTESEPMDPKAALTAVCIHGLNSGDYSGAAEMGLQAIRRMPHDVLLRNNTAYMLALAGRGNDAQQVLGPIAEEDPAVIATRGLVLIASGDLFGGCALYRQAAIVAAGLTDKLQAQRLTSLMAAFQTLALRELGIDASAIPRDSILRCRLPADWEVDPDFLLLRRVADRTGAGWPPTASDAD